MRRLHSLWLAVCLSWHLGGIASGDEFKLANENILRGELASADEDGLVVKLDVGGFSKREPWINFSQETLKEIAKIKVGMHPCLDLFCPRDLIDGTSHPGLLN